MCSPHPRSVVTNSCDKDSFFVPTGASEKSVCLCAVYLPPDWLDGRLSSVAGSPLAELQEAQSLSRLQRSITRSAKSSLALQFKFRLHLRPHTPPPCAAAEGKTRAAGPVCESGGAHHRGCVQHQREREREAGLPGTVGIEQREKLRALSIKTELFALWE